MLNVLWQWGEMPEDWAELVKVHFNLLMILFRLSRLNVTSIAHCLMSSVE